VSCSYTVLWNAFKRVAEAEGFSEADKHKLFYENAKRVYSLDVYLKPRPIVEDDH
jgi:predicted TIM-barrel fold metal-dependent hydrolase